MTTDQKFALDVQQAMRMLRADVMRDRADLPAWLTAHLDTCERCGAEKVWAFKPFSTNVWEPGVRPDGRGGQGYHYCSNCNPNALGD